MNLGIYKIHKKCISGNLLYDAKYQYIITNPDIMKKHIELFDDVKDIRMIKEIYIPEPVIKNINCIFLINKFTDTINVSFINENLKTLSDIFAANNIKCIDIDTFDDLNTIDIHIIFTQSSDIDPILFNSGYMISECCYNIKILGCKKFTCMNHICNQIFCNNVYGTYYCSDCYFKKEY
jgi:hypothetical protein